MKIFRSFEEVKKARIGRPVITWGVFDGVHRGHQFLFKNVLDRAKKTNSPTLIITFQNHPERILGTRPEPLFLASLEHRVLLFQQLGIDYCLILEFTKKLSSLTAEKYLDKIAKYINPVGVVVTDNIAFGKGGQGNVRLLEETFSVPKVMPKADPPLADRLLPRRRVRPASGGKESGISLKVIKTLKTKKKTISSTLIRQSIKQGDLKKAAKMLGMPVSILGTVIHGEGRGKELGFPTANLDPHHEILPPNGVYIAKAILYPKGVYQSNTHSKTYKALVNVGVKPTFHSDGEVGARGRPPTYVGGQTRLRRAGIEVYLSGYRQKGWNYLYGKDMLVEIICKLRDECKFPCPEALIAQIQSDLKALKKKIFSK